MNGRFLLGRAPRWLFALFGVAMLMTCGSSQAGAASTWADKVLAVPYPAVSPDKPLLQLLYQDVERLGLGKNTMGGTMTIGTRKYDHGIGTHANSRVRIFSPDPIAKFTAMVGIDNNSVTNPEGTPIGSVILSVVAGDRELYKSRLILAGEEAQTIEADAGGARIIDLVTGDGGWNACDWTDWADAAITTVSGKTMRVEEIPQGIIPVGAARYPFSFLYDGKPSDVILDSWAVARKSEGPADGKRRTTTTWTDPATGLRLTWTVTTFAAFPAIDWVLYFENTGSKDTATVEDVRVMDMTFRSPMSGKVPYRLHCSRGGTADNLHYEPSVLPVGSKNPQTLDAGEGRSSNKNFPFFKVEMGQGSIITAVGWSGFWKALIESQDDKNLHIAAGMFWSPFDKTHFLLHPGERVRTPSILIMNWEGDTLESNAQFRQLVYKHYAAKRNGKTPLPIPFCNTCFTRGGLWLNECNAENQISLIKAYAKLGLEALITDAGWYVGGFPAGAGNWTPRKDAYPNGIEPVAAAAKERGMIYGLWFEPEKVIAGTRVHREHPEWCLSAQSGPMGTYLLNFALPEVQDYFFNIVKGFMEMPGFRVYRQDFWGVNPYPYWRFNDAPDRQGINEMKYVEGLYAYWDRIAQTWPDSLREECAGGGHRIDLEVIKRMHISQKTDYWFDDEVDQAALWSVSQYLPNNCIVAHLNKMDDYSFHSTMASSLCLGWIADAPDFDLARGKKLLRRYLDLRHLLIGSWYPLMPYSRDLTKWIASQYHRADLEEGMILVFRRPESQYDSVQVSLHGLKPDATYELAFDSTGRKVRVKGKVLMKSLSLSIPESRKSDLIHYRRIWPK